jgi:hypothetical protein
MSASTINRGPITDRVLTELAVDGLPVGDNSAPTTAFGWQGEPNADGSNFIPWMAAYGGTARPGEGSFADSASEWRLPYTVTYAGVTRNQLDWIADKARKRLVAITREVVATETGNWKICQIRCTSVGATNRVGSPFPDYYTQSDLFEVWLSKERS